MKSKTILKAEGVGVDSGIIVIADRDYYKRYKADKDTIITMMLTAECKVSKGEYDLVWKIENTWNGPIEGSDIIKVTSGELIVSDPCYIIADADWDKWLKSVGWPWEDDVKLSIKDEKAVPIQEMGGDGVYDVEIELTKRR